jgi:hypothetical protein
MVTAGNSISSTGNAVDVTVVKTGDSCHSAYIE